jgi:CubicO group peptidase (beta-lactamase class C family)
MRDVLARLAPWLEAEVAAFVHDAGVPGVAAAASVRGEPPWAFAYGVADAEDRSPIGAATAMRVGSLTKPFTAATILRLRDGGRLSLDDPVTAHLEEFARVRPVEGSAIHDVRVRDLVLHRAGLPGEVHALDEEAETYPTIDGILEGLAEVSLLTAPGTAMRYSNLGYQLLGEIAARRAGASFERSCEERVIVPLGLSSTSFDRPPGAASGHRARAFTDRVSRAADRRKRTTADGGLWSTAVDQAAWIAANVDPDTGLAEMHGPVGGSDAGGGPGQGLGWFREVRDARTLVYHQGSTPGFAARVAFSPPLGGGAVVLANGETATADVLGRIVDLVLDAIEGAVPSEPAPEVPPPPEPAPYPASWDELVGFYVWPGSAMLFRLEVRAGRLRLVDQQMSDHPIALDPVGDETFVALDGGWAGERVRVRRDPDGRVRGLRLGAWLVRRLVEA